MVVLSVVVLAMGMQRKSIGVAALAALALLAGGCGGEAAEPPPSPGPGAPGAPQLLKQPLEPGEIRVAGAASPGSEGPFRFEGRYEVRFAQYAPEAPGRSFGDQTPFVARLLGTGTPPGKAIPLFHAAREQGSRTLEIDGRYVVEVLFGDFPYVVRFTPAEG